MNLSKKDQSFILLIVAVIVIFYSIYSLFSHLFLNAAFHKSQANKIFVKDESNHSQQWLNVSRPLKIHDLKNRVVLLDFWTYSCVKCTSVLSQIKKLEQQFGSKLTVIGVHSGMFDNGKDLSVIKKAILKNKIDYPVVNDADLKIWNNFKINAWPSLVLIDPYGKVKKTYVGVKESMNIASDVKKMISKHEYTIDRTPLPIDLERSRIANNVLSFPTKIEYSGKFSYKSHQAAAIFIANSSNNNIVVTSLLGEIILKIGSGQDGSDDGDFGSASFSSPHGLLYRKGKLYVADTGSHSLREVDFETGKVTTLVGLGKRGGIIEDQTHEANKVELSSPTDIEFFPDYNNIVIANSGTNQLLTYNIEKKIIDVLAGNGQEGMSDGVYPDNSLAQTSDLSSYGKNLYFLDAKSSSLRVLDHEKNVKTLIGQGIGKSGYKNGTKKNALMQHPSGLTVDDTGAYIVDSFNHAVRKYDLQSKSIKNLFGGKKRGDGVGSKKKVEFDEPEGIISALGKFYIVDSNNNRVLAVNRANFSSDLLDVMPPLKLTKEGFLQYLPNLQETEAVIVAKDKEIFLNINLKKGWKINEAGPSFVNLLNLTSDDEADLLATYDWITIKDKKIKLPKLSDGNNYTLQGVIYFCEDKKNALCNVESYEQKIEVKSGEKNSVIELKLAY